MNAEFKGVCPFCKSYDIEVENSIPVEWGNNDQGTTEEDWHCKECNSYFHTKALVEVSQRELIVSIFCPYCQDNDKVERIGLSDDPNVEHYWCSHCRREFSIRPERWYEGLKE